MMCSSCRMRAFSSATMWPSLLTVVIFFSFAMLPGDFGTKIILFGESASGGAGLRACPNPRTEVLGDDWEEVVSPLGCSGKRTEVRGLRLKSSAYYWEA